MRRILAIAVLAALAACDCDEAATLHTRMCVDGYSDSCEWLAKHYQGGACVP